MAQEEIIEYLQRNNKENVYFTANEISQNLFGTLNDRKVRRALRSLVSYGEVDIKFKRCHYGFIPCYKVTDSKLKNKH